MKKSTLMLGVASMALVALVSCKKDDTKAVSFQATASEFVLEDEDRAYLDTDNCFVWEQGDQVKMFNIDFNTPGNSECANFAARTTGRTTVFDAVEQMTWENKGAFYSFFPAANVTPDLTNKNRAKFAVNPVQEYYMVNGNPSFAKDAMYCASKAVATNIHQAPFSFDNICGILRLKFYDANGRTFRSIRVEDANGMFLSGNVSLKVDKVYKEGLTELCNTLENVEYNSDQWNMEIAQVKYDFGYHVDHDLPGEVAPYDNITLDLGENGVTLATTKADASVFYFVLRPMALQGGYRVIGVDMNGVEHEFINSTSNKTIKPNTMKCIAAQDVTSK
jgi:hypothetical protein